MLQAVNWWLLLTTLPPQKDCHDVSLQGLMSSFIGQHQHQIWAKCAKIWGRLAWEAIRGHLALLLSSQALNPLYIHNNSQVVNYFCTIYRDKHLSILVTDEGTKKRELRNPDVSHCCPSVASKVQYVLILRNSSLTANLGQKIRCWCFIPVFNTIVFQQSHWLSGSA